MLSNKEQKHILGLAKKLAKVYYEDKITAKRLNQRFLSKSKSIQQVQNELLEYLKEAG
jgi:hypothetical protein